MTKQQLVETIDDTIALLRLNKDMAGPELLAVLGVFVANADGLSELLAAIFGDDKQKYINAFKGMGKAIEIEKKMTDGEFTERLIRIMTALKNRPLILKLVASLI